MSVGQPCAHCKEGHVRPFQFSFDQAILLCDNAACDSLYEASPWEKVIDRSIRQPTSRLPRDLGQYRFKGGSSSSSGVQSDTRSPLLSPAQSLGSVTDKEVELLLRKSYAPPKLTKHLRVPQEKFPSVTNPARISPAKSQNPMLKTDSKCESFFELLNNLDLELPARPAKGESPTSASFDDVVTAELESWMKGFEYPEPTHIDKVSNTLCSDSVEVNPTSTEPNLLKPYEETLSELPEEQKCIIPSLKSAFSQVSPKREKRLLNFDTSQYISAFKENEDITKILADSIQENFSNSDSLVCTLGSNGDLAKDDLSLLCDSQFLSPPASAASNDSGYNEEDANKLATITLPQLQEDHKLSSCSDSIESSHVEVNETAKCKSVGTSSPFNVKNLSADLEVSAPQDIHFNIHPAMVTVEKSVTVDDPPDVEPGSVEPNEDGGSLPVNHSTSDNERPLTADDERDVEASNSVDFEKEIVENVPSLSGSCSVENTPTVSSSCSIENAPTVSRSCSVENTPNVSSSCSVDLESNGSHSMSGDEGILRVDGGATSDNINFSQSVTHEPCEDVVSVASSHSGSTLPSDIVEDEESKTVCSDQSSDALSLCSSGSINQCKGSNRGRGRGRGRGKRRGRGRGYNAGNVRSSDSNQEVGDDGQPQVKGIGRGRGRGPGRGRGQRSVNILPGSSEFQPSKRPRVAAEILHRQTRQRTGSIEVQASTAPRERSCERTSPVDCSDGSMRRGLSSLLQGQKCQNAEQKDSSPSQNFTNLKLRSLLSGSFARDPWSVMEVYLEELDIEVVVQGTRSSPDVPSEGASSPGTCRTTEEAANNLQQEHDEESEDKINEVKSKELDRSDLCTPMADNNSALKVSDDDQVDVLSQKGRPESDIDQENSNSEEDKREGNETDDRLTTRTSRNEKPQVVSKDLELLWDDNTDDMDVVQKLCNSHSSSTASLPFVSQDNDKVDNTTETSEDSQVLEFAQKHQQKQTKESSQDAKSYVSEPERDSSENLGINEEQHSIQYNVQPCSSHNYEVTGREQICVLPNENVHSYEEFALSDASAKGLMDSSKTSEIKERLAQGFRENQEHNIGTVNKLSKVIVNEEANSLPISEVNLTENKQQPFTLEGSDHCISLPIEKQVDDEEISHNQLNVHQIVFDTKGDHTKETAQNLSENSLSLSRQNGSTAVQNPSCSEEFEVKNKSASFTNFEKCDNVKSHPNAVVDLPINYECNQTKEVDSSLQDVPVLDVLKNFLQDCNGLVVRSGNNEGQLIKDRNKEDQGSNSVTGFNSSSQEDDPTTVNEVKECNSPSSETLPNASSFYLLLSPDMKNVRSWMGHLENSSLEEEAQKMLPLVDKDMQCTSTPEKNENAEATVKGSSSKYFESLLQDIDFDDKFFQCPVQEHPSKTFDEHINSSLFFGETAGCSSPQTNKPESPICVKNAVNQDLDEKYRDTCYLEQGESCLGSSIQTPQYPVCKVSEYSAAVNAISTTSIQIYSESVHTNVALATFPTKLPEACTWITSCSSPSHAREEDIVPKMKPHIPNVSFDKEAANLPYTQTFTSTTVSVPKTPYPSPSYSTVCTTSVLPTVTSTIVTTVPSVMINSVPTCSSIPESKVDTVDRKSKRKKKHLSLKRHRTNVVRKEENRNEDSQVSIADFSTRKCHSRVRNEIHDSNDKTRDYLGATCAATGGTIRSIPSLVDQSGCDSEQREPSINLPSASVSSVAKTIDDRVVSLKVGNDLQNASGVSEVIEDAEEHTVRVAKSVPSGNVYIREEPKCFQSRNDCHDEYGDFKPANSQLPAVESMAICDREVSFIINAEKPGTSCDGDGDDDIPIISIDSEDEIQIILPEKKCKYPKKTNDVMIKTVAEECVSNSANSCIMQNAVEGNPEIIHRLKKEEHKIGEILGYGGDLKVKSKFLEERMSRSDQGGRKRMVEDADEGKVIKKQRIILNTDGTSDDSCSSIGAPICGILDNSVVHDKKCFSPRVKGFVDFDENGRSIDSQKNRKFYVVSKKSGLKQYHDINALGKFELGDTRKGEPSHILNQNDTLQGESLCHAFDSAMFCQGYKFGSTKSSPQHEIHPALESDESNPGLLELDCTEAGFLSVSISSPESCIASPEPLQREFGFDSWNCHSVNSFEGIASGQETSGIESRLTDRTQMGISGSESEDTVQPTSGFETETSVYDGSEEESESECEDSWESHAQKTVSWSSKKIPMIGPEGKIQLIPVVDSDNANDVKQLQCVKPSHSLTPENLQGTCRPEKTSWLPCVPVMPICPATTSSSLTSHTQFSKRAEERNLIANPQTHIILSKTALSQGSAAEHQGHRTLNIPLVPPAEPTDVHLRNVSSHSWGVPLMTTSGSHITNSTNVMQTHYYIPHHGKQESAIDYKTPISPKPLTIVPPALVPSYSDIMPTNKALPQAKTTCLTGDTKSTSAHKPQERLIAIKTQTANGPVTRILRVIKPTTEHSDQPKEHYYKKSSPARDEHIPVESLIEKTEETDLENNMLKKVKMGSKGGFYMRPTLALKNAVLEMRKKKSELAKKVKENAENSKYVELPDGEPICHPLILSSERKERGGSIKSKRRRKKMREKIKRERITRKFVREKVQETMERSKDDCVVPEMVVVCVGGKLHLYRRDIADTCAQ